MHAHTESIRMPNGEAVETVVSRMRLMSDPTRLRILCALEQGESDVSCLADLAGAARPSVSQHLAKLRLAGMVRSRREGQRVVYELTDPVVRSLVTELMRDAELLSSSKAVLGAPVAR